MQAKGELGLYLLDDLAKRSKDLNTYLKIDRVNITAEIVLDTTTLKSFSVSSAADFILEEENGFWISEPVLLEREGSISSIDNIAPAGNWKYRLGRELIWFGNFEDEGCTLWEINHPDEFYDTTVSFTGKRSLCQERPSGLLPLNTNLEKRIKLYSDTSNYTLHAQIKTDKAFNAGVIIQFFETRNQSYPIGTENLGAEISGTTGWSFYNNGFSLPGGAEFMNLRLRSESPQSGVGYSWFDNVGLIEWTDWQEYNSTMNISNPNDYYWLQIKINEEILNATVNYTEIIYSDIVTSSSEEVTLIPIDFILYQNYPNPFNPSTTIQYELPAYTNVQLKIYDILGNEVRALVNESQQPGRKIYQWDGKDDSGRVVSSGVYFYQLRTKEFLQTKKLMLLK